MSYAESIIELKTRTGMIAISAFKIRRLRSNADGSTEVTYTLSEADTGGMITVIAKQNYEALIDAWKRGCQAWEG